MNQANRLFSENVDIPVCSDGMPDVFVDMARNDNPITLFTQPQTIRPVPMAIAPDQELNASVVAPSAKNQAPINPVVQRLYRQWQQVLVRLQDEFGETAYQNWLKPIVPTGQVEGEVLLAVPTRFMRDWINRHYRDRIRALWMAEDAGVRAVEIIVSANASANLARLAAASEADGDTENVAEQQGVGVVSRRVAIRQPERDQPRDFLPARQQIINTANMTTRSAMLNTPANMPASGNFSDASRKNHLSATVSGFHGGMAGGLDDDGLSASLDPRFTFDNFIVGKPNELAHAAARRVAESDTVSFNPLFLYGGVGLGKTHLMHAIAWAIRARRPDRKVLYLSAEKFMYQFIRALRYKDTMAFKEQFRNVDVLMIDDVQFISGKDSTQEEFFHTFNALVDQNRQIIISADKSPSDLEGVEERLRSRLGWGLVADIHPTSYELRLGILQSKAESLRAHVPPKVLEFMAHKITANIRELEGALNRIVAHAELVGREITLDTVQELLRDLLRASDRRISIDDIQRKVAEHYNIRVADMHSARRARLIARPRQVAMYLAKQLTARSLPEIGRKFGGRDHTTVMHAVRKIEELCTGDVSFAEDVELLKRMLTF
jgi:chromosomal replication initiator protein